VNPNPYAASLASGVNAASDRQRLEQAVDAARLAGAKSAADVSWIMHGPDARPKDSAAKPAAAKPKATPVSAPKPKPAKPAPKPKTRPLTRADLSMPHAYNGPDAIPVDAYDANGNVVGHYSMHPDAYADLVRKGMAQP
jgi:hypothetical protein